MSHQMNTTFDNDLDAFLNYDQNDQTPMSSSDVKPVPSLLHQTSDFTSHPQTFSGPSYQYDSHRQQTGLPMGAYANTLAVNEANGLRYRGGNNGFVMPTETLNIPLSNLDDFDFNHSQFDMDAENDSPADVPSMFYAGSQTSFSPASQFPTRIYPGMHTDQANHAKMQQAQKQQEMMRQPKQLPAGQKPLPSSTPSKSPTTKDPHVEESISRLLNRMRQSSTATGQDDDDDDDSPLDGSSGMPRIKKDEDDMDEDERLLNSEEGKKLSSKERRQLRNKVSARAFRSRRKEYITQLENEVAGKVQEANDLRVQNRQLMEENTRLTDLTRMLLSSQAFSGFLQELSNSGVPNNIQPQIQQQQQQRPVQQAQPQPQASRKDVPSHEATRQMHSQNNHMQVGMTLIPDTPIDMSVFDGPGSWNNIIPSNNFSVFSVTEMPEPPKLDLEAISGKTSEYKSLPSVQKNLPVIPSLPVVTMSKEPPMVVRTSDDLYDEDVAAEVILELPASLSIILAKAAVSSAITAAQTTSTGTWSSLEQLCEELDEMCERVSELI